MKLKNFDQEVDRVIVDRGYEYYQEGLVQPMGSQENVHYFEVSGSDLYSVTVRLESGGNIAFSSCTCPYDYGPVCKHETAVYFELADGARGAKQVTGAVKTKKSLGEILSELPKEELVKIITDLTVDNGTLENRLVMRYSRTSGTVEMKHFLRSIVRKYTQNGWAVEYDEVSDFARELGDCLTGLAEEDPTMLTVEKAFLVLQEAVEAFQYADDSYGDIGMLVDEVLDTIESAVHTIAVRKPGLQQPLFDRLLQMSRHRVFNDWEEYGERLLQFCIPLATTAARQEYLRSVISSMIEGPSGSDPSEYRKEQLAHLLYDLIIEYGTDEEADAFVRGHRQYSSFRKQLLKMRMAQGKYDTVIELAKEGEQADAHLPGLVNQWKEARYAAYQALDRPEEQRLLAKDLLLSGEFQYYKYLKALSSDPSRLYGELKEELRTHRDTGLFLRLIEAESDLPELLAVIQQNLRHVETYAEKLYSHYPDEVQEAYRSLIRDDARMASHRKAYRNVCRMIRRYGKLAGAGERRRIAEELAITYKRKSAFLDELSKL